MQKREFTSTIIRYAQVSIFGYSLVYLISNLLIRAKLVSNQIYTFTYLIIYIADYIITSQFVFKKKLNWAGFFKFVLSTFVFLIIGNIIFFYNSKLFDQISISIIFTGLILSPFRYLISKNYVYTLGNSLAIGLYQTVGDICRCISASLKIFDRKQLMRRKSDCKLSTWIKSLLGFQNIELLIDLDLPWWPFIVEEYLENFLRNTPNARVFEWGSGASTFWLSKRCKHVTSVEHDEEWSIEVKNLLIKRSIFNVSLEFVPAEFSSSPIISSEKLGNKKLDFSKYVNEITKYEKFDLIVVDGRVRKHCLMKGLDQLTPNGILILDNSNRRRYEFSDSSWRKIDLEGLTPASPWKTKSTVFIKSKTS